MMMRKSILKYSHCLLTSAFLLGIFFSSAFYADDGFGAMAGRMTDGVAAITKLLQGIALVAGIGFAIAAIFKFKQHKDNPTQIPVGTPIALVFIGAALIFLPALVKTTGASLFDDPKTAGDVLISEGSKLT